MAGAVLAGAGFSLSDRQTPVFGRVGQPGVAPLFAVEPFRDIDHREGVYAGVEARYLDRLVLRALHYDNRADPTQIDYASHAIAWDTRFDSLGARLELDGGWTAILQWLDGEATIAPGGEALNWPFRAEYALVARTFGRSTLSARYDLFSVEATGGEAGEPDGAQQGHAVTVAYVFNADAHWRFTLEWLRVRSSSYSRQDLDYGPGHLTETQLQLAVRYAIGATSY